MLASSLISQLQAAVEQHGDHEVMDETESIVEDVEFVAAEDEADEDDFDAFILTT